MINPADEGTSDPGTSGFDPGPGQLLRQAREAANLSVRDVSARMHLDEHTIAYLEDDRFDALPAPTFIRGYLRGYARLLEVPDAPIIEAFDRQGFKPPALVADISERQQARSSDLLIRGVTLLIVAALIGMVTMWWRSQGGGAFIESATNELMGDLGGTGAQGDALADRVGDSDSLPIGGDNTQSLPIPGIGASGSGSIALPGLSTFPGNPAPGSAPGSTNDLVSSATGGVMTLPANPVTGDANGAAPPGTSASAGNANADVPGAADGTGVDGGPPNAESASSAESTGATPDTPSGASETTGTDTATAGGTDSATGAGTLVLRFNRDSWLEVYDANDKRLFFDNARANRVVNLKGPAPLRLVVGRAESVAIEFNGKPFDLDKIAPRGGIARFKIGG